MNRTSKMLALILMLGLTSILGCSLTQAIEPLMCQIPPAPTRPEIGVYREGDIIKMSAEDLGELNVYILELERIYRAPEIF